MIMLKMFCCNKGLFKALQDKKQKSMKVEKWEKLKAKVSITHLSLVYKIKYSILKKLGKI